MNKCSSCKNPLKHVQNNQWMCDQSLNVCEESTKIVFIGEEE